MQELGLDLDLVAALDTPYSSPESLSQPKTPDRASAVRFSVKEDVWGEDMLDRELELMMAAGPTEWELLGKRTGDELEGNRKRSKYNSSACKTGRANNETKSTPVASQHLSSQTCHHCQNPTTASNVPLELEKSNLHVSFTNLRDNYLTLCTSYNTLLSHYQNSEAERAQMALEREHAKSLIAALSAEVGALRRREREVSFGKPKPVGAPAGGAALPLGHATVTDRLSLH